LLKTGQLREHAPDPREIAGLLQSVQRNLKDCAVTGVSAETRFSAAYRALLQSAIVALMANGYRPSTAQAGHHATVLQSLPKTIGTPADRLAVLDALRRKRNLLDYTGEPIDEGSVTACRKEATALLAEVQAWLKKNRPELLK